MKSITSRFVLMIASAAVAPLLIYGVVSIGSLRSGVEQSAQNGNAAVATQIAERIQLYFEFNERVLRSIAAQLQGTDLEAWQKERILRNHALDFPEFREITIFDTGGGVVATSRVARPALTAPAGGAGAEGSAVVASPTLDREGLPTTTIALPVHGTTARWIVGELSLERLWSAVDAIRVGKTGFAVLLDDSGTIIAHGRPDQKHLIASRATGTQEQHLAARLRTGGVPALAARVDVAGEHRLAVAAAVRHPDWTVIIQQPVAEALGIARALERQLLAAIGLALLVTIVVGTVWGQASIRRIFALTRAARALASGDMAARVSPKGEDELRQLGDAFNSMADRLVELQDEIRRQERQALFGRIAAGLVHDLSHPIQTISNSTKLINRIFDDADYRATFRQTVERELGTVKRVLDDLRNIANPIPLEKFPVDASAALREAADTMLSQAEAAGVTLRVETAHEPSWIEADLFALGRVHRNLILNAIQATAPGGLVVASTEVRGDRVLISVADTGCGIPAERLGAIFDDFMTTKRRGLGLGLAISKKIVEQLGGRITVASVLGSGTTFVLDFPRTQARQIAQVAG